MSKTKLEEKLRSEPQPSFILKDPSSGKAYLDLCCKREIDALWKWFYSERDIIIHEEWEKDMEYYHPDTDGIYYDNYIDHWRIDDLHHKTCKMEDEIYGRYQEYEDALLNKLHGKEDEEAWVCRDLLSGSTT